MEDVEEMVEESSIEGEDEEEDDDDDDNGGQKRGAPLHDSIEVESEADMVSSSSGDAPTRHSELEASIVDDEEEEEAHGTSLDFEEEDDNSPIQERESKRRRVSISPAAESEANLSPTTSDHVVHPREGEEEEVTPIEEDPTEAPPTDIQQPTFRPAPRFKPIELGSAAEGLLPAAFSPQRRGAKYVAGGLAAEMQGWLSEVKGWEGVDQPAAAARLRVQEIRGGSRMYLVRGWLEEDGGGGGGQGNQRRFLLAGEGRLTGLGRRAEVGIGSLVAVGQPVWDIQMGDESWTVACDWSVL